MFHGEKTRPVKGQIRTVDDLHIQHRPSFWASAEMSSGSANRTCGGLRLYIPEVNTVVPM